MRLAHLASFPSSAFWVLQVLLTTALLVPATSTSAADPYGLDARPSAPPYLNVPATAPVPNGGFIATVAFPNLTFQGAVAVRVVPGTNRLWVLEREGRIWSFEDDPATTTKTLVLDLNAPEHVINGVRWWCQGWDDCGLMGLAFHPQFGQVGSPNERTFFLAYQARNQAPAIGSAADVYRPVAFSYGFEITGCSNRLGRFTYNTAPATTAGSEVILIDQPDRHLWHNGADLFFGNDGFLYTLNGDEGKSDDSFNNSQRINRNFLAGVVRIDVDGPRAGISHAIPRAPSKRNPGDVNEPAPFSGNYGIPNDNPFVGVPGVLEEFYALGLRSPHRMTYDPLSGQILVGDIGQGLREEVDLIVAGGNYQWAYKEGHKNHRSDRIPSPYQAAAATTAGVSTVALTYVASDANPDLPAGMLNAGDRVRFANHTAIYQILSVSGYPHTAVVLSSALLQAVPAGTAMIRTTGFTIASLGTSTPASDLPNDLGSNTITVTGTGALVVGSSVSFSGVAGSYQIIAANGSPNTTSITVRPALSSTPAIGARVDRLTVIGSEQPPVMDFARNGGTPFSAIIGGHIYRGSEHAYLSGKYILADNQRGSVYAITGIGTVSPTIEHLFTMPNYAQFDANGYRGIGGFGLNHDNEPLICRMQVNGAATNTSSGQLWKISRDSGSVIGTPIPNDLKDTGAFTLDGDGTVTSMTPNPSLIPYEVNSPLWSDAAHKRRWVSIPNGQQVTFTPTGAWIFPAGTVFVKHFELTINEQTNARRRLETRLLVRSPTDDVYGMTYKWNAAGTQATLVSDAGISETYTITAANGTTTRTQTWNYPSRNDCLSCHNANAGYVLGVSTRQLNGSCTYPTTGVSDNQLRTWGHIGLFDAPPSELTIPTLTKMVPVSDSGATLDQRVRSWLDANCSHCHRPGGVHANFDTRFDTPLAAQGIVDGVVNSTLGVANARVIAPGSLLRSLMHTRDNSLDPAIKMPPLAKNLVDTQAIAAMEAWIASLATTAEVTLTAPSAGAVIVRATATTVSAAITGSATITSVDFVANGALVGTDATAPYSITWSPAVSGTTILTALAHTNVGDATSPGVSITVNDAALPPSITLTSPNAGSIATAPATITFAATASDVDGTITQVEFLQDGVVVASDTNAPYQGNVANLAVGTYSFTARATDSQGLSSTTAPAVVVIESPSVLHGLLGTYYDNQDFTGTSLTRLDPVVDFTWGDGVPIAGIDRETFTVRWQGSVRTMPSAVPGAMEPYAFSTTSDDGVRLWVDGVLIIDNWTNHGSTVDTGTISLLGDHEYAIVMEFYDGYVDATARLEWSSPAIAQSIIPTQRLTPPGSTPPPPQPPTVAITAPVSGSSMLAPGAVTITANASDTDGTIAQVEFLQNGVVVATDTNAPYTTSVSGLPVGSYSFTARATDSQGLNATSAVVLFAVTAAPVPPTIALTSPVNGATAIAPATVALSATASDSDGTVTQVEFLQGGVVVATDTSAPYTASISGLAIGSYVFAARATDTQGLTTTTLGATVTVTAAPVPVPPTVALTAPTNGATATAPAAFTLSATASDSDGTVTIVEFMQDGLVIALDTTAPFTTNVSGVAVGSYTFAARATDSQGLMTTSTTVTVTVTAPSSTQGLAGTYYDNRDFTGTTVTRIDPTVDFIWGDGAPIAGIDRETFSVRWQGNVRTMPGAAATYSFYTTSDDGVRLWVNGVLLIDHWNDHGSFVDTGTITLVGDQNYPIVMEFYDNQIDATARLEWSSAAVPRAIIPTTRLSPPGSTPPPPQPPTVVLTAPINGVNAFAPATFALSANASDSDATISQVEFLQDGVVIATATAAPYTASVSGLAIGSYTFAARATDSQGLSTTSATATVTVIAAPIPPSVALTAPVNGASATTPGTFALAANASDSDGTVAQVEFLQGGVVVASDSTAPYTASISGLAVGSYTFAARATDSQGLMSTTATVTVSVTAAPIPPNVALTAPVTGTSAFAPATFALSANASDSDGTITVVEFLQNGVVVGTDTTAPYTASVSDLAVGSYTFAARASDSQGLITTSATVAVTVTPTPIPPTVALTAPTNGTTATAPATFALSANASDSDGTVTQVEFLQGGVVVATDTIAPYTANVSGLVVGSYTFAARATDSQGLSTTTAAVAVSVTAAPIAPTVALTAPTNGVSTLAPGAFALSANASDSDGTITVVEFLQDGVVIGTDTTAPYTANVSGLVVGSYTFAARATDSQGLTSTATTVSVAVTAAPVPPTIALTTPVHGASAIVPGTFALSANASDSDGTVTQVEFLQGGVVVATDTVAPYTANVSGLVVGSYTFAARATDSQGLSATTATVTVTVTPAPIAPTVALTAPTNGATATAPATFTLTADASDSDGIIGVVEFMQDGVGIELDTSAPYATNVSGLAAGTYIFTARATDSQGLSATTATVTVTVTPAPIAPTVALTAPTNGVSTLAPGAFALAANASDSDGTITVVEFLQGGVVIATDTTAPYTANVSGLVVGSYTFAARATDSQGLSTTTANVTVTVTAVPVPPSIVLTAPTNGATATAPATFALSANASDSDGTVTQVEFLQGGVVVATDTVAPYTASVNGLAVGTYTFAARATDSQGLSTTSANVTVSVTAAPTGTGVLATYFDNKDFTGTSVTRIESVINFAWGNTPPAPGIGQDTYSVRWRGRITPPSSGVWTFYTTSDDGVRLWIDNALVINNWTDHGTTVNTANVTLTGGQTYEFAMDFYENAVDAIARLEWSSPTFTRAVVATQYLAPPAPQGAAGTILREWWTGISGNGVANLTSAAAFPLTPAGRAWPISFEAPTTFADNYGTRMSGYVIAPITGNYVFWIAGDDNCELWLSSNDLAANKVKIANVPGSTTSRQWTKFTQQQSVAIPLTAGSLYYIEALHKEGVGGDNLAVGWQLPGGTLERPIPGNRLMPFIVTIAQWRQPGWSVLSR